MKYLFTIKNKAIGCFVVILLSTACVQAQKNTDSPYSRYGAGLLNVQQFNGNYGLSGAGIAWRPFHYKPQIYDSLSRSNTKINDRGPNFINPANPASWSNISLTTFEAAVATYNTSAVSGDQSRQGSHTQLSHVAIGLPLAEKWGMGFGLRPFSYVGYDYGSTSVLNNATVNNLYEGSGGVSELFLGTAYEFAHHLSVGIMGKYKFGTVYDDRRLIYPSDSNFFFNTLDQRITRISALTYDFGVQYFKSIRNNNRIVVGVNLSPITHLDAEQNRIMRNYTGVSGNENFRDTSIYIANREVNIPNAATYGVGIGYEKKQRWMLMADFKTFDFGDETVGDGIELKSGQQIHLGFDRYINMDAFGSYWKKMGYRGGMRYNSSLLTVDGEDIPEFGISFGISMPLRKSFSTVNFGFELGRRGKDEKGLVQEDFFNFQIGVTINDKWFIQRKYD